ncbi:ABC transporter, CydDC cysteine exporter (CydDC-E) family, permease/ATP-binding protein CydD [Caldalkalibacillus thermarum TA2.A1]|uniref:ABC transporter, CydDC cysteine exporter (CydDC-E) family, permease/ATP-binding protein CydD n=1 Tax=Caldalkalibacillus thermarum (strain TA2.A1) TaxID=986075 RepID=F5L8J1_CALTT|nr:thiol reductant ABC exporter subunit CydD [Caldalkalibacillus thermarum]EGL82330.1 ABC transporter, CydDC cysteine exporter (CydDC-E) family, permease/ATP-binding protein CydD [Caldalkalibacillus thermarum TA2.A1]QZT32894.1 thiol reductant ABC exporter subunit CydD [Caldalkalibacillus thermarum TA2.A1]
MSLIKTFIVRRQVILMGMLSLGLSLVIIGQAYLIVGIISALFLDGAPVQALGSLLLLLFVVITLRAVLAYLNGRVGIQLAEVAKTGLRQHVLRHLLQTPFELAGQGRTGEKVSVLLSVVDKVDPYYRDYLPNLIRATVVPLCLLTAITVANWPSALIIVITAPFIPIFMAIIGQRTKEQSEQQLQALAAFSGRFLDSLQGLPTLKLFGRAKEEKQKIKAHSIRFREATLGVLSVAFTSAFMMELIAMLSMGLIALQLAISLIMFETISFQNAFFVLLLAPEFYQALKELSSAFHTGRESITAAKTLEEKLGEAKEEVRWGDQPLDRLPPELELKGVSVAYQGRPVLKNITATIAAGRMVAIVGPSGAGKTTLLRVIAGLVPVTDGQILINGQSRENVREEAWFDQLSYIAQHPYIFSGSIYDNVALANRKGASKREVFKAIEQAGLAELVALLEQGIQTPIGEGGRGLSGGEKQRLALARAFVKQPSLVLFDEPTKGLDLKTEQILLQSMSQLAKTATVITVAHRLHTVKQADWILVLDQGEVVAQGTHADLEAHSPHYRQLLGLEEVRVEGGRKE